MGANSSLAHLQKRTELKNLMIHRITHLSRLLPMTVAVASG